MTADRRAISLSSARADGWLRRLGEGSPNFKQLCDVVGEKIVAFSIIAGVRITALMVDRRSPDATLVDFVVGDEEPEQRLSLGEFRRRLGSVLLDAEPAPEELPDGDLVPERLQALIGFRYVLLAPVFGMGLEDLHVGGDSPPTISVTTNGEENELDLEDFREVVRNQIRAELARSRPASPFSIDLAAIPKATRALEEEDWDGVIEQIGAWPGPLSLLLRTHEGQTLSPEVKATLARALGVLGSAYVRKQRHDWAEEVMRLGIQWGQDGPASGELFRRLGEACVARGRHGEAIGLLRRARSLGEPDREVLPALARCYADRRRYVAAALCAEHAIALGAEDSDMVEILKEAARKLGAPWGRFRERVPAPTAAPGSPPRR